MMCDLTNPMAGEEEDNAHAEVLAKLGPHAASAGFWYVIDADSQEIHQPIFFHLFDRHARDGVRPANDQDFVPSHASNRAAANELVEWLRFLNHIGRPWDSVDGQTIGLYASLLESRISVHTGRKRAAETISHKLSTIYNLYTWSNAAGITSVRWDRATIRSKYQRAGRDKREACDDRIRPFSPTEMRTLLDALGPLPSLRKRGEGSGRDRLLFETGLLTGMRGEEICHLSARKIKALKPDANRPNETLRLWITVTKGRKGRYVALPNSLVMEMQHYIRNERTDAVRVLIANGGADRGYLFVNLPDHRLAGAPLKTGSVHKLTHKLMLEIGCCEIVTVTKKKQMVKVVAATHSFHDTRHTYAVNLYICQRNAGDPKPWETVQRMLGHKSWKTTEEYYTNSVGVIEPLLGIVLARYWEQEAA
ncbi:tyrosine-type recombinase/integrase [Sphingomonas sp. CLY1604]|uniref:tyrosine-type recombinase/integrase n=1 Tax=Sphingomonas sp. CLY1604 TaxID=3457786 RepID=UPI003FD8A9C7